MRLAWTKGFQKGQVIGGRFELGEPLGRGGFGIVLRARDLQLRRVVAFKALPPGRALDAGTLQEAEVAAQLSTRTSSACTITVGASRGPISSSSSSTGRRSPRGSGAGASR
jgi:eukaryotic-like serine/threonine-protein kinase